MNPSRKAKIEVRDYTILASIGDSLHTEKTQRQSSIDIEREIMAQERRRLLVRIATK